MTKMWFGAAVLATVIALASPSFAQGIDQGVPVAISSRAHVADAHHTVLEKVKVTCGAGLVVLEAFAYVVQDGHQSNDGPIPVSCDNQPHKYIVRVPAGDQLFHRGSGRATAYVLVQDPNTGQTSDGQDSRDIMILQ